MIFINYYQRLKDIREDKELKQKDIADILHIDQSDYAKYENGKHMMGIDKYIILAKYYNVSLDYLCGLTNKPRTIEGKSTTTYNKKINIQNNGLINIKQ